MKKLYLKLFLLSIFLASPSSVYAADELFFKSNLSGAQEATTPPGGVDTDTSGEIVVRFDKALSKAEFRIVVRNGTGITQAHFHCSPAGVNGPVVAFLFGPAAPPGIDVVEGAAEVELDNSDIIPPENPEDIEACGVPLNNIASLAFAMLAGKIYANVHSTAFPAGVIRGQLLPGIED
jgi:hypothetical protein